MCLHPFYLCYQQCNHLVRSATSGFSYIPAVKCPAVAEAFRQYHFRLARGMATHPSQCPVTCPAVWGTLDCCGNVIAVPIVGKCPRCYRLDFLTSASIGCKQYILEVGPRTVGFQELLRLDDRPMQEALGVVNEMKRFIRLNLSLFEGGSLLWMWNIILSETWTTQVVNPGVDWFLIGLLQSNRVAFTAEERRKIDSFLRRHETLEGIHRIMASRRRNSTVSCPESHITQISADWAPVPRPEPSIPKKKSKPNKKKKPKKARKLFWQNKTQADENEPYETATAAGISKDNLPSEYHVPASPTTPMAGISEPSSTTSPKSSKDPGSQKRSHDQLRRAASASMIVTLQIRQRRLSAQQEADARSDTELKQPRISAVAGHATQQQQLQHHDDLYRDKKEESEAVCAGDGAMQDEDEEDVGMQTTRPKNEGKGREKFQSTRIATLPSQQQERPQHHHDLVKDTKEESEAVYAGGEVAQDKEAASVLTSRPENKGKGREKPQSTHAVSLPSQQLQQSRQSQHCHGLDKDETEETELMCAGESVIQDEEDAGMMTPKPTDKGKGREKFEAARAAMLPSQQQKQLQHQYDLSEDTRREGEAVCAGEEVVQYEEDPNVMTPRPKDEGKGREMPQSARAASPPSLQQGQQQPRQYSGRQRQRYQKHHHQRQQEYQQQHQYQQQRQQEYHQQYEQHEQRPYEQQRYEQQQQHEQHHHQQQQYEQQHQPPQRLPQQSPAEFLGLCRQGDHHVGDSPPRLTGRRASYPWATAATVAEQNEARVAASLNLWLSSYDVRPDLCGATGFTCFMPWY